MTVQTMLSTMPPDVAIAGTELPTFTFTFDAVPASDPQHPPVLLPFGPPSLTALVTVKEVEVEIHLLSQGLPPGSRIYFDKGNPLTWHAYNGPETPQPDWVVSLNTEDNLVTFKVENPAGTTDPTGLLQPIVAGFTPNVLYVPPGGGQPVPVHVPDPSIVNVDPTGGTT